MNDSHRVTWQIRPKCTYLTSNSMLLFLSNVGGSQLELVFFFVVVFICTSHFHKSNSYSHILFFFYHSHILPNFFVLVSQLPLFLLLFYFTFRIEPCSNLLSLSLSFTHLYSLSNFMRKYLILVLSLTFTFRSSPMLSSQNYQIKSIHTSLSVYFFS